MGRSTHPFVLKMNEAKAFHRAMRAGETKHEPKDEVKSLVDSTEDRTKATIAADAKRRFVTLERKQPTAEPPKGVLSIVMPK